MFAPPTAWGGERHGGFLPSPGDPGPAHAACQVAGTAAVPEGHSVHFQCTHGGFLHRVRVGGAGRLAPGDSAGCSEEVSFGGRAPALAGAHPNGSGRGHRTKLLWIAAWFHEVNILHTSCMTDFPKIFCETSQKLVSVEAFALAAKYYSVQNLGICTPFEQLLVALQGNQNQRIGKTLKAAEFMNMKKSHEVQAMSELIGSIANYYGLKQVIDLGSGKGYLSSFLSLKYGLKVYGIDSSNTNTHGAEERNRKLKKHWKLCHTQSRLDVSELELKMSKERKAQNAIKNKADIEEVFNNSLTNQEKMSTSNFLPDFSGSAISNIRNQMETLHSQPHQEENLCFENVFPLIDLLPINAIEPTSSQQIPNRETSEVNKERRKMTSKSRESNIYLPLTSFITADSELHDIIEDLEDCLMVGLHTCGDLAPNTLRIFASNSEIKGVCSVGCCYHLLSEEFENQHKVLPSPGLPHFLISKTRWKSLHLIIFCD
ncbi:putative methyltransferase-like protein 25 isoform X4 [Saimiri boliviensis]|uniref:putative methyltransferase-like protein 25 isoform X4 n=1 Tax=Saimiri boliviensis TaxID=27679 RepID=UPI003D76C121